MSGVVARQVHNTVVAALLLTIILIAGCAYPTLAKGLNDTEGSLWRGRLALRVAPEGPSVQGEAGAQPQAQSFSAGFELTGNAQAGGLLLFSPLGTTVAELIWSAQTATLKASGETRSFDSLGELLKQATGTEIPVASLFAWLAGDDAATPGWQADVSEHALGRIVARRTAPRPPVELRLVIDK